MGNTVGFSVIDRVGGLTFQVAGDVKRMTVFVFGSVYRNDRRPSIHRFSDQE
jgi:hypothetical protein